MVRNTGKRECRREVIKYIFQAESCQCNRAQPYDPCPPCSLPAFWLWKSFSQISLNRSENMPKQRKTVKEDKIIIV